MIVLAVGMPRAGSGWHYQIVHDLVMAGGGKNSREIRRKFFLGRILTEVNCNIRVLSTKRMLPVLIPSLLGNTYAIKVHSGPRPFAEKLIESGMMKVSFIYRDPRAAMLSALEYGERARKNTGPKEFAALKDFEDGLDFIGMYLKFWDQWIINPNIHSVKYEELLSKYDQEVQQIIEYLALPGSDEEFQEVVEKYRPGKLNRDDKGVHFKYGIPERFRDVFTTEQLQQFETRFGDYLDRMGYER